MTAERKSKLIQGLVFGAFFIWLGNYMKMLLSAADSVKQGGVIVRVLGGLIALWGLSQLLPPKR